MANYFILQKNDESAAYAFKVTTAGYKPQSNRNQREQFTVTGALDIQIGPNVNTWSYSVKLTGEAVGSFTVSAGTIMTATTITWGDYDDLKVLFALVVPPTNKLRFRDVDDVEYYVYFSNVMRPQLFTPIPSGEGAYLQAQITLVGTAV